MIMSKEEINIKELEKKIYRECCKLGREMLAEILMEIDEKLMYDRDRGEYRHKGKRVTVMKTIMGEVEFERRVYEHKAENGTRSTVYLLDQALGYERVGYMSEMLAQRIAETSCEMSYRKAAQTVSELTGQAISHTGAWNVVQALGERVDAKERQAGEKAKSGEGSGRVETKLLFEEQDGIYLTLQGGDRKRLGKSAEMKIAIAYTGAAKTGAKRYNLTGKVACANFEGIESFYTRKEGVIAENYNVDEIEMRIVNGDGASWIKRSITDETVHYQLDTFHRNKAVLQYVSSPEARKNIFRLLYSKQIESLLTVIKVYATSSGDAKERENYLQLLKYFQNNKDGLISYKRRGLELPSLDDGIFYRGCGAMESNVYSIIGHRMKNRRANWSIRGGNNLARLLTLKSTGKLADALDSLVFLELPLQCTGEIETILSASKVPHHIGKGYNGFAKATIPPSQKWLKDVFAFKNFC